MFIRIGFEIGLTCRTETTLILALLPHSSYAGRIVGSDRLQMRPSLEAQDIVDPFGNRLTRLKAPVGDLTIACDCIVEDDGAPDPYDWNAIQHDVADLPPETLPFLTASRYCESDAIRDEAWKLFGETPPGWARVQAIANFVHNHLTFGYGFGRPTKTAADALRERTGALPGFRPPDGRAVPGHEHPGPLRQRFPRRHRGAALGTRGFPGAWTDGLPRRPLATRSMPANNTPRIGRLLMAPRPRRRRRRDDDLLRRLRPDLVPGLDRRGPRRLRRSVSSSSSARAPRGRR